MGPDRPTSTLLAQLARRDRAAWQQVMADYRPPVFAYLLRMTKQRELAVELTQVTFVRLAENAAKLAPDTKLLAWLLTVAHNAYISQARAWRAAATLAHEWQAQPSTTATPADALARRQIASRIEAAMANLSPAHRSVVELCLLQGLPSHDAANILGISADNVRARLHRAREQLTAELAELMEAT